MFAVHVLPTQVVKFVSPVAEESATGSVTGDLATTDQVGQVCVHSKMIHICDWWLFFPVTLAMPTVHLLKGHTGGNRVPCGRLSQISDKGFTHLDRSPKNTPHDRYLF